MIFESVQILHRLLDAVVRGEGEKHAIPAADHGPVIELEGEPRPRRELACEVLNSRRRTIGNIGLNRFAVVPRPTFKRSSVHPGFPTT